MKRDITEVYICGLALDVCVGTFSQHQIVHLMFALVRFYFLTDEFQTMCFCLHQILHLMFALESFKLTALISGLAFYV